MFRTTDVVLFAAMVCAAAFTFKVKHEAQSELAAVRKIEAQIRFEQDTIDLLKADFSLLTQPARLQRLAEAYQSDLKLAPTEGRQYVGFDAIPRKPVPDPNVLPPGDVDRAAVTAAIVR